MGEEELEVGPHLLVERGLHQLRPLPVPLQQVEVVQPADLLPPLPRRRAPVAAPRVRPALVVVDQRLVLELLLRLLALEPVERLEAS